MAPLGVGDCIAVTDLLIKIVKVFKESGGAAEEYQDLEEHAIALNAGLGHLRTLERDPAHQTPAAFRQALNLCEKSLQQLCQGKAKYGPSLGKHAKTNKVSLAFWKMQWALLSSKDMKDLRIALNSEMTNALSVLVAQLTEGSTKLNQESTGMRNLLESLKVEHEDGFNSLTAKIERLGQDTESRITDATNALTRKITSTESSKISCCRPAPQTSLGIPSNASRNADELLKDALVSFESSMENQMQRLMRSIHVELAHVKTAEQSPTRRPVENADAAIHAVEFRHRSLPSYRYVESCVKESTQVVNMVAWMLIDSLLCFWIYFKTLGPVFLQTFTLFPRSIMLFRQPIPLAQDSICFLNALGQTHYLPFIYFQDYKAFEQCLHTAFSKLPGTSKVAYNAYILHNLQTRQVVKETNWKDTVFSGSKLGMSILMIHAEVKSGHCPRPACRYSFEYRPTSTMDSFTCPKCKLSFSISEAKMTYASIPISRLPTIRADRGSEDISVFQRIHILQRPSKTGAHVEDHLCYSTKAFFCCKCGMGPMGLDVEPACVCCGAVHCADCIWDDVLW